VVFIDELPWLDTKRSDFLPALGHFWNNYASANPRILFIVCGSATSWIIKNLLRNRGALHNRVTGRLRLEPLSLGECEELFRDQGSVLTRYQQAESYMVFGGIPFYLNLFDPSLGLAQNIDRLCFAPNAALANEYEELYTSLFDKPERHLRIVEVLAEKTYGMTRDGIIHATQLPGGGNFTRALTELEQCGFITSFSDFTRAKNGAYYRLTDPFTSFSLRFMAQAGTDRHFWSNAVDDPRRRAWSGIAFEQVCLAHIDQIRHRLGVSGVSTSVSSWRSRASSPGAQIDLVLDRRDGVINLCEIKYSGRVYTIDKSLRADLERRVATFAAETETRKALHLTTITPYGLVRNANASVIQSEVTADDLFWIA
jgi:hypothetical protein